MAATRPPPTADMALNKLCASAGQEVESVLRLLQKILGNIKNNPKELKYRRVQTSGRVQKELLCYKGAKEFMEAAGFVKGEVDVLELSAAGAVALNDALLLLDRRMAEHNDDKQRDAIKADSTQAGKSYREAMAGGARGAGRQEMDALARTPEGLEALKVLEKVLSNVYRFPTTDQYKSVNLSKGAGLKLRPAMALLRLAGFEEKRDSGEDKAVLSKPDLDAIQRLNAMLHWAVNPAAAAVAIPARPPFSLGALLGVAVGDALGAPLEMTGRAPLAADELDRAMEMCGGGHWGVSPGQITDDTEQTICLADSLAKSGAAAGYPANDACFRYSQWYATKPFEKKVGMTTKNAFRMAGSSSDMERRALTVNKDSQANIALMRSVPLAVWGVGRKLTAAQLVAAAQADARLSHPHPAVVAANVVYVLAVAELIRGGGAPSARDNAIRAAKSWVDEGMRTRMSNGMVDVDAWLREALGDQDLSDAFGPDIVWCKWGFVHAFRHLKLSSSFEDAMRATLAGGGDTDTNAAIVGGMIGAAVGVQGIPERWIRGVLVAEGVGELSRPAEFHPARLPKIAEELSAFLA